MKKAIALLVAVVTVLAALAGCSTTGAGNTTQPASPSAAASASAPAPEVLEPITFTSAAPLFNGFKPTDTAVQKKLIEMLSQKLGRQITLDITYYDWQNDVFYDKMNLLINSGDLPDLVPLGGLGGSDGTYQGNATTINKLGAEGMFACLNDYDMPNYKKLMSDCGALIQYMYDENGKCYFVPMFSKNPYGTAAANMGLFIDKTVFDQNKIAYPTTIDTLYNAAVQLKALYPDSNPIIPISLFGGSKDMLWSFSSCFRAQNGGGKKFDGTKYVISGMTDSYKDALGLIKKLYDRQLIPKDYSAWSGDMVKAAKANGKAFIFWDWAGEVPTYAKSTGHEYLYIDYALAKNEHGWWIMRGSNTPVSANTWGALAINAKSKYVKECAELINAYLSDDIFDLLTWGIEGESYTVGSDGVKVLAEKYLSAAGNTAAENPVMALGIQWNGGCMTGLFPVFTTNNREGVTNKASFVNYLMPDGSIIFENPTVFGNEHWSYDICEPENCVDKSLPSLSADESAKFKELTDALFTYIVECQPKFIEGEMSLDDDWTAYLEQCKKLCDIDAAEAIYNNKLESGSYYNK